MVATRFRSLGAAAAISFGLHFLLDFVNHFEAFYPLSLVFKQPTYEAARLLVSLPLAAMAALASAWLLRKHRPVRRFAFFALALCPLPFEMEVRWGLVWLVLLSALGWAVSEGEGRRWVVCALAACLPDALRHWLPPIQRLHNLFHYQDVTLGDWASLLGRGTWRQPPWVQAADPYYWAGWGVELLLEGALLAGAFYLLVSGRFVRHPPPEKSR